jgi:hypothetical protein
MVGSALLAATAHGGVSVWEMRVLRMEGAAVGVRRSAESVEVLAQQIADSGRIQRLSELKAKVESLHRKVVSARLASEVLHEGVGDYTD